MNHVPTFLFIDSKSIVVWNILYSDFLVSIVLILDSEKNKQIYEYIGWVIKELLI